MRCFALFPIVLLIPALVLSFLCLFAGDSPTFLEDFQVITLNVSQLGAQTFSQVAEGDSTVQQIFAALPENIQDAIAQGVNTAAQSLGIPEFYNAHIMTWCGGDYEPSAFDDDASRDVLTCSSRSAGYRFDPREQIQDTLDAQGIPITVSDLGWPTELDDALDLVEPITLAAFILYVVNCVVIFIALLFAVVAAFRSGRWSACCNIIFDLLALLISAATSAIVTVASELGSDIINDYGADFGVQAAGGRNFLIFNWVITGCLLVTTLMWCVDCCCLAGGRKRRKQDEGVIYEK